MNLFNYNRANYMYNRGQEVTRDYQGLNYRLQQFALYRQDIRDLVSLTASNSANYHVVTVLQIGMCVTLMGPGRLPEDVPEWVRWHHLVALSGALAYLITSLWLATRACIIAESFNIRLQTQYFRLPVPDKALLNSALRKAEDFEGEELDSLLRLPFVRSLVDKVSSLTGEDPVAAAKGAEDDADDGGATRRSRATSGRGGSLGAFADGRMPRECLPTQQKELYQEMVRHWQVFDAYARVTMSVGTYLLILAVSHYHVGWALCHQRAWLPASGAALSLGGIAFLLAFMDLNLSMMKLGLTAVLFLGGPVLVVIGATYNEHASKFTPWEAVAAGLCQALLVLWLWHQGRMGKARNALPSRFRGVMYMDVFDKSLGSNDWRQGAEDDRNPLSRLVSRGRSFWSEGGKTPRSTVATPSGLRSTAVKRDSARNHLEEALADRRGGHKRWRHNIQAALRVAEAADLPPDDAAVEAAGRAVEALEVLDELRHLRRVAEEWTCGEVAEHLEKPQREELSIMLGDLGESIAHLQGTVLGSRGDAGAGGAGDALDDIVRESSLWSRGSSQMSRPVWTKATYDAGGFGDQNDQYDYWVGDGMDYDELHFGEEPPEGVRGEEFIGIRRAVRELVDRSDRLCLAAGRRGGGGGEVNLASLDLGGGEGGDVEEGGRTARTDGTRGVRFDLEDATHTSTSPTATHTDTHTDGSVVHRMQELVRKASEPFLKADHRMQGHIRFTMPVAVHHMLCGGYVFMWLCGAGVHLERWRMDREYPIDDVNGRWLGAAASLELSFDWPRPFFRPSGGVLSVEGDDPESPRILASNGFLVYDLGEGSRGGSDGATELACPVARHDALIAGHCGGGGCGAVVAASGALWRCVGGAASGGAGTAAAESPPEPPRPLAALPRDLLAEAGGEGGLRAAALGAWAAADRELTRLFAAPRHGAGAIVEFRRTDSLLRPVAELPLPPLVLGVGAEMDGAARREKSWEGLVVLREGEALLAIASPGPVAHAWNLATGTYIGSWPLPATSPPGGGSDGEGAVGAPWLAWATPADPGAGAPLRGVAVAGGAPAPPQGGRLARAELWRLPPPPAALLPEPGAEAFDVQL